MWVHTGPGFSSAGPITDSPHTATDHYIRLVTYNTDGLDGGVQVSDPFVLLCFGRGRSVQSGLASPPSLLCMCPSVGRRGARSDKSTIPHKQLLARAEAAASILLDPWVPFDGLGNRCVRINVWCSHKTSYRPPFHSHTTFSIDRYRPPSHLHTHTPFSIPTTHGRAARRVDQPPIRVPADAILLQVRERQCEQTCVSVLYGERA